MKTNREWREWGERDPLYGAASWQGREKGGSRPWTDAEFYALGDDWLDFLEHWQRYATPSGTVVEIGSGAGRITSGLAGHFARVIAIDVSEGMLGYAKSRVGASNIEWLLSDGTTIPAKDGSADAAFSCHVLQHFESTAAQLSCFREIHRVLRPGGTFMVHMHLHEFPVINRKYAAAARTAYCLFLALSGVKATWKRAVMRFGRSAYMHGVSYESSALANDLRSVGFAKIEFSTFPVRANGALHTCVFGLKP